MKKIIFSLIVLLGVTAVHAAKPRTTLKVSSTKKQTVTGFGGACCDGAMQPFGTDNACVGKLYGKKSKIGLNIMRMEISPSFEGTGWGNYNWNGSLPSVKIVKQRGGIVFGTPWSPPGEFKTNGTAQGGKVNPDKDDDPKNQRGKLREDCYDKFFPWLNTFLDWMQSKGVNVDAVSIQNEPDWWVNYSGCLYTPEEEVELVKNYAYMLDRDSHNGVKLISGEPLGYTQNYIDPLMQDEECRKQIDIVAGHLYGHLPLAPGNMRDATKLASQYGKEVWMTEHSVTDNIDHMPNWNDNLIFAEELNECMLAGCTGYIYWYLRAHWAFCGTGKPWTYNDQEINFPENKKDELLPRAFVMSHFSKNVTGSTRLETNQDVNAGRTTEGKLQDLQFSAYQKGDSIIVMAINANEKARDLEIRFPYNVKSGQLWLSTGNESENLCQKLDLEDITESIDKYLHEMPGKSLSTFIFTVDDGSTAIENVNMVDDNDAPKTYYDLHGRRLYTPHGLCIERSANGESRKVLIR